MSTTRRDFLHMSAGAVGALGMSAAALRADGHEATIEKADKPLRLLILGGTGFIGPHMVRYAVKRGHDVTIFTRGRRDPAESIGDAPFTALVGDRDNNNEPGLSALETGEWDAVIDNSGYVPRIVGDSANLLKDRVGRYVFTSTLSVYASNDEINQDESAAVGTIDDPTIEQITGESYGPLKALCEQAVLEAYGDRGTVIRPGLIVGPGDSTDRFSYWPVRIDRGGEVLAPGDGTQNVEFIDARDLAEFTVKACEDDFGGVYNAVGPSSFLTMAEMLYGCRACTSSEVSFTWVDWEFLQEQEIAPWQHMTVWVPRELEGYAGFGTTNREAAVAKGLTFRPLATTVSQTLEWWATLPEERRASMRAGLDAEKEAEALKAWHEKNA